MFGEPCSNPLRAEMTQHHPQLQGPEPPTELDARVHQVPDVTALRGREVLRRQRERVEGHRPPPQGHQVSREAPNAPDKPRLVRGLFFGRP